MWWNHSKVIQFNQIRYLYLKYRSDRKWLQSLFICVAYPFPGLPETALETTGLLLQNQLRETMTCNTACKNNNPGFHSKRNSKKNLSLACLYWKLYTTDEAICFRITDKILSQPKQQLTTPLWIPHRSLWALATFPCNVDFTFIKTKKKNNIPIISVLSFTMSLFETNCWELGLLGLGSEGKSSRETACWAPIP